MGENGGVGPELTFNLPAELMPVQTNFPEASSLSDNQNQLGCAVGATSIIATGSLIEMNERQYPRNSSFTPRIQSH
jgi:hypothetical protein